MRGVIVQVEMARGGTLPLEITGRVSHTTDGAGQPFTDVEIDLIEWPKGGLVRSEFIKDMSKVEEDFVAALEDESESAWLDSAERYL